MKKFLVITALAIALPLAAIADNTTGLWKKYEALKSKDLPKSQISVLDNIISESERAKRYGDLLKAETERLAAYARLSADSVPPTLRGIEARQLGTEKQDKALSAVYACVLANAYGWLADNVNYLDAKQKAKLYRTKALAEPELLARTKAPAYKPFVKVGADSGVFGNDLLSVIGFELNEYALLNRCYDRLGNRPAALLTALRQVLNDDTAPNLSDERAKGNRTLQRLDSLINRYGDLPECGEVALAKFDELSYCSDVTPQQKGAFIDEALKRWPSWRNIGRLRTDRQALTNPYYDVRLPDVALPGKADTMRVKSRNLKSLTYTITRLNLKGQLRDFPSDDEMMRYLAKAKIAATAVTRTLELSCADPFEVGTRSVALPVLEPGMYLVETTSSDASLRHCSHLISVSDMFVATMPLPYDQTRITVLNATTGHPVPGAGVELWIDGKTKELTADQNGNVLLKRKSSRIQKLRAFTDADCCMQAVSTWGSYSNYGNDRATDHVTVFTDRAIYRPGQTVHASALAYSLDGLRKASAAEGKSLQFALHDANGKQLQLKKAVTDDYGTAAVDFELPSANVLPGTFSVRVSGYVKGGKAFRVEEYKRPTYRVEITPVEKEYHAGDTLLVEGKATTYAGVPVQGARVAYRVKRSESRLFKLWGYGNGGSDTEMLLTDTVATAQDGTFTMRLPLVLPDSETLSGDDEDDDDTDYSALLRSVFRYYRFNISADVTDQAGESHQAEYSLRLGTRPTAMYVSLADKVCADSTVTVTFNRFNAAAKKIDGTVRYWFDKNPAKTFTAEANKPFTPDWSAMGVASGRHELTAVCGNDTVSHSFTLFSLADRRPAADTPLWTYITSQTFPRDGKPVMLQVGSSLTDANIFYSVITDDDEIHHGCIELSDSIKTFTLKYDPEYGEGLLINLMMVRDGKSYTQSYNLARPLEDKSLTLKWTTFRDRLTPGQKETWTLNVRRKAPVDVINRNASAQPKAPQLLALMYDKSLDEVFKYRFGFSMPLMQNLPYTRWATADNRRSSLYAAHEYKPFTVSNDYSYFDYNLQDLRLTDWPIGSMGSVLCESVAVRGYGKPMAADRLMVGAAANAESSGLRQYKTSDKVYSTGAVTEVTPDSPDAATTGADVQMRENLQETAFFYPALYADKNGDVKISFTLPESVTTWKFYGLAHDTDMNYGVIDGEAVASKQVMVMPNVPRFVRTGDDASISTRVANTTAKRLTTRVVLTLENPLTGEKVYSESKTVGIDANATANVAFGYTPDGALPLLVCKISAEGKGYSDGEQHYLPVLPVEEKVMNTVPFTLTGKGDVTVNMADVFPEGASGKKLTVEYTANPSWLLVQALPYMAEPDGKNAISTVAAYYANRIGKHIMDQNPAVKTVVELWRKEPAAKGEGSLASMLEKNQELKTLVLDETPWLADADHEADQKRALIGFFDESAISYRLSDQLQQLRRLQNSDGSWSWWKDMPGSPIMTGEVAETLARLKKMTGDTSADRMIDNAMAYLGNVVVKEYQSFVEKEKKGEPLQVCDMHAIQYLYINSLLGRELPARERPVKTWLLEYLRKDRNRSIGAKAKMAVVLASDGKTAEAKEYVESIKQYTVSKPGMGRYFDSQRARYSWADYRIPEQTAAIEAIKAVCPDDKTTLDEMRLWLLQSKRTQAWDTPVNSVNAVYAFLDGNGSELTADAKAQNAVIALDGKRINNDAPTAGLGYQKVAVGIDRQQSVTVAKTSDNTSWGAVYAQFSQRTDRVADASAGMSVKREVFLDGQEKPVADGQALNVGDKIRVRLTVTADRDYDFVQLVDKRAACEEPADQLSGGWICYRVNKDNTTYYYFNRMSKGTHVVESTYYIDRTGSYTMGTCTVQCAYSPEFCGRAAAKSLTVE